MIFCIIENKAKQNTLAVFDRGLMDYIVAFRVINENTLFDDWMNRPDSMDIMQRFVVIIFFMLVFDPIRYTIGIFKGVGTPGGAN